MTGRTGFIFQDGNAEDRAWVHFLVVGIGLLISSSAFLYTLHQVLEIDIFRHDALNYASSYFKKLRHEGRWINYLLFDFLRGTSGRIDALINLSAFFGFSFIVAYRWTRNVLFSVLVALLMVQAFPLYAINLWPFASMPAFVFLLLSALLRPYLPIFIFFPLFGVAFFATYSGLYYLLLLLYLDLLRSNSVRENLPVFFGKLLPAWAIGFLLGYGVLLLAVHHKTGQWGLELAAWRTPQDVTGPPGLVSNALRSFEYFSVQLSEIFSGTVRSLLILASMFAVMVLNRKAHYVSLALVCVSVMLAHYFIVIPVGIEIKTRTVIGLWTGVFALAFFVSTISRRQAMLLVPGMSVITCVVAIDNRESLHWYNVVTRTWQQELLRATPLPPADYDGVVFLSDDDTVARAASLVAAQSKVQKYHGMEGLHHKHRWMPVARASGFKKVWLCAERYFPVCETETSVLPAGGENRLYNVWSDAEHKLLVVEFNQAVLSGRDAAHVIK